MEYDASSPKSPGMIPSHDRPVLRLDSPLCRGQAHGKVILLGEHAVVYGAPAVALSVPDAICRAVALPSRLGGSGLMRFRFRSASTSAVQVTEQAQPELSALVDDLLERAADRHVQAVDIVMRSSFPAGRGLGSSAACARAAAEALNVLLDLSLSPAGIHDVVQRAENRTHGRASGIDTYATGSPGLLVLDKGRTRTPAVGRQAWVVIADSGTVSSTRQAVEMLRTRFVQAPGSRRAFLEASEALTVNGLHALAEGDLNRLGMRLNDAHALLQPLGLVTHAVQELIDAALAAGALGAKMTGGGLGGCAIALTDTAARADAVAARLRRNGAEHIWRVPLVREEHRS
ncbi:mevalonate kinase [Streptomyces cellulosae]